MMPTIRYRIAPLYRRLYRAFKPAQSGFRALIFHHVAPEEMQSFCDLLDYVEREHGFLTPCEAEAILSGESTTAPGRNGSCLLTFDDGFQSNYELAQSVLLPRAIRAIFFVCPGLIDAPSEERARLVGAQVFPNNSWTHSTPIPRLM